jgi:hypothetical protein
MMALIDYVHVMFALSPGKEAPDTHSVGGLVGPRARLPSVGKRSIFCLYLKLDLHSYSN